MKLSSQIITAIATISFSGYTYADSPCEITCDNLSVKSEDATNVINEIRGHIEDGDFGYWCCNGNTMGSQCTTILHRGTAHAGICDPARCIRGVIMPTGGEGQNHIMCGTFIEVLNDIQQTCLQDGYTGGKCESDTLKVILY